MNARRNRAAGDLALARGLARSVYDGSRLLGMAHPGPRGWIAETAAGELLGTFRTAAEAAHAVALAGRAPA